MVFQQSIILEQKPASSVKDCPRKCKQTTLIWQRNPWQKTQMLTLFINQNESNILKVYFAKTALTVFEDSTF